MKQTPDQASCLSFLDATLLPPSIKFFQSNKLKMFWPTFWDLRELCEFTVWRTPGSLLSRKTTFKLIWRKLDVFPYHSVSDLSSNKYNFSVNFLSAFLPALSVV